MKHKHIDINLAKSLLNYNHETGIFTRISPIRGANIGDIAGTKTSYGYIAVSVKGVLMQAHRLAWAMHYGVNPYDEIDHINGIRDDNRICNLRECHRSGNSANRPVRKDSKSGFKGVFLTRNPDKWYSQIRKDGKVMHLGVFENIEDAAKAYEDAAKKYHGEFARV